MATDTKRQKFLKQERERLTQYQHQHRGVRFLKLWLPPTTDRNVNIIGLNNHIYKGKVPTVPLDELPPEVDPESIDEEQLYREIRDMKFPEVPPLEPLGPARRVGGEYTKSKRFAFAPVTVPLDLDNIETPILGTDGKLYRGTSKVAPPPEMNRKLAGSKRPVRRPGIYGSSRENVIPTVVSLYVDGKPPSERRHVLPIIEVPYSDLKKMVKLVSTKKDVNESGAKYSERQMDDVRTEYSDATQMDDEKTEHPEQLSESLKSEEREESDTESTLTYTSNEPDESSGATTEPTSSEVEESSKEDMEPASSEP
ncbi:uncharacterized protein NPIL_524041, partial [Nephila pilipes]